MNKEIEIILVRWCKEMVAKYGWLTIKYEYSPKNGVYLVSFSPLSEIEQCDEFNVEVMKFEDEMNAHYGNNAPLFCDEERNFKFSENVEIIRADTKINMFVTFHLNDLIQYYSTAEKLDSIATSHVDEYNYNTNTVYLKAA